MRTRTFLAAGLAVHARTIATTRHLIFRRAWLWTGFLAFAAIALGPPPAQAAVTEAWVQRYGSESEVGTEDYAYKVVTDAAGNVIVAGSTQNQTGGESDMVIIKYSGAGVPLWTNRYDGTANSDDKASAVAVDASGNVFVTGGSSSGIAADYATIKYSGAGVPLWTNRYDGAARAVAVDASGNVFVTGGSFWRGGETIAYSGAGVLLWTNRYPGSPRAVAVDGSGNVVVTGNLGNGVTDDYYTAKYAGADGAPLWERRYNVQANSYDVANAMAVDASGNVFVTGYSNSEGHYDYATIAYSGAGVPLWTNRYNGSTIDQANAVAVDGSGNVFVTGWSGYSCFFGCGEGDYTTIAYSGAGVPLWTNRYNGSTIDQANAVAVDGSGNVFVTGYSGDGGDNSDYATIAYSGAGVPLWTNRYNGPAYGYNQATAVAVDGSGNVFVTGSSYGSGGNDDYATIVYSGAGVPLGTNRYGGRGNGHDIANAVAVDGSGNVFVTGYSFGIPGYEDYATIAYSGAGVALWTNRYNGPDNISDQASAVAVDGSGKVFVTGSSYGSDWDYATIAYSGAGVPLWTNRYDGPQNAWDRATAVAVDASGNVFVTGNSGDDYATIAYSGAGVPLWTNRYNGTASAVAVDGSGNVFVTGNSATIAYSGAGVPLWTNLDIGSGTAIALDGSGNVFVTGGGFTTIAYSGAGVPLWTNHYNGTASAVAVDGSGNVFVTGNSYGSGGNSDYATIAYSGAGVPLWTNRYNGPANGYDQASAVAVDGSGNVFVTGYSGYFGPFGGFFGSDYATIAYSGAGVALWTNHYHGPGRTQTKSSLAIGSDGAVYVAGTSDEDFATVKYVWQAEIAIQLLSTISPKVNLTLSGAPNSSWTIERALELTGPWTNLSALLIGANGSAQFQDINSPYPAGFYRARQE